MPKPAILLIIVALSGALVALWRGQTRSTERELPLVRSVAVNEAGVLTLSGSLDRDCFVAPQTTITRFPDNLDIQLVRERSSLAACGMQAVSFAVEIGTETDRAPQFIIINDEVWARNPPETGGSYEAGSLFPANIDSAAIAPAAAENGAYRLSFRGSQAIGCALPEVFSLRETVGRISIGVYNAMSADTVCPDMLVEIEESFILPATNLDDETLFAVNTFLIDELENENVTENDKVLTNIFRVDVTLTGTQPRQVSLDVEGEHPDGCEYPVQVQQMREGNTVQVEVYREVPADVFCPMILRPYQGTITLDGDFAPGSYTIKVNSHSQTLSI